MLALDMVRATELQAYRVCRRRWLWDREQKIPAKSIPTALWTGGAAHRGLEFYYQRSRTTDDLLEGFRQGVEEQIADLVDNQGFCREAVLADVDANYSQFADLLIAYERYDKEVTQPAWTVVETERRYHVELAPGVVLTGQIDLLVRTPQGLTIVDHKTLSRTPDKRALHLDTQISAYHFLVWKATGELPVAAILNVLLRKKPSVTVRAPKAGASPWQGRFVRLETERSLEAIQTFEGRTLVQMREMAETARKPEYAYPHPGWQCPSCAYYHICLEDISGATGDGGMMPWEEQDAG